MLRIDVVTNGGKRFRVTINGEPIDTEYVSEERADAMATKLRYILSRYLEVAGANE